MPSKYSAETQEILQDFLALLDGQGKLAPALLAELRRMAAEDELHSPSRIKQAIATLEGLAHGQDR
jgi:hypothetical protein